MRLLLATSATSLSLVLACSGAPRVTGPGVAIPLTLGEGTGDGKAEPAGGVPTTKGSAAGTPSGAPAPSSAPASSAAASNGAPASSGAAPAASNIATDAALPPAALTALPDPEPLRTVDQVEYTFIYESGAVRVGSSRRMRFERPVVSARKMGRYAVELSVGRELIDRVRFDFPMLATDETQENARHSLKEPPPLTRGPLRLVLLVPFSGRARRVVLVDRATGKELELAWPPVSTAAPSTPAPTPPPAKPAPAKPASAS